MNDLLSLFGLIRRRFVSFDLTSLFSLTGEKKDQMNVSRRERRSRASRDCRSSPRTFSFLTIWAWKERKQAWPLSLPPFSLSTPIKKEKWEADRITNHSETLSMIESVNADFFCARVSILLGEIETRFRFNVTDWKMREETTGHTDKQRERADGNEQNVHFNRFEFFSRLKKIGSRRD